jgi:hypothetical protein
VYFWGRKEGEETKQHDQKISEGNGRGADLLETSNISCKKFNSWRIFNGQTVTLAFNTGFVDKDTSISGQT